MLIAKADDVGFVMKGGRKLDCPARACMLHDDSGKRWPSCSVLIASIRRGHRIATKDEVAGAPRDYYGRSYEAHVGSVDVPSRDLSKWKLVGSVEKVFYDRFGDKAPGPFKHTFNKARGLYKIVALVRGKRDVQLYKLGSAYRLELGGGCLVTDLGLVWP